MWTKPILNQFAHQATERWAQACDRPTSTVAYDEQWPGACLAAERAHRRMVSWNCAWLDDSPGLEAVHIATHEAIQQARKACDDVAARRPARL